MRTVLVALVAIGLAFGVVVLWPDGDDGDPPTTEAILTTATTGETSTTESQPTTTTTTTEPGSHVVETVEEAEEILRQLWFGWFEGIYNQDEDRIREVVVLEDTVVTAMKSFGVSFTREPRIGDLGFLDTEILRADTDCLAVWTVLSLSGFRNGESGGVEVLRWVDGDWLRLSTWAFKNDLWETDCESSLASS